MPSGSSHPAARVRQFFGAIAQRYDLTNRILSGGLDVFWRKKAARLVRRWNPVRILDLATGSGDLARELARACPGVLVVGADFSQPMLARARAKGVAHLVAGDGLRLPFAAATFDAVTVAFGLRNMESWPDALGEMARVLRPGGRALIMDFSMPPAPLLWLYRPYLRHILP
ncbi:MAG TPA: class I SAM-dependent methyltransferase, partial [Chthoniobacteraceae bacterium]|nr:class I SAM-dependent methyltransferase [Chthoniobacteraceae bacterium]